MQRVRRFLSVSTDTPWMVSGTQPHDRLCFTVNQEDVRIWGAGVYLGTERTITTLTLLLSQMEPSEKVLSSATRQWESDGTQRVYDVQFDKAVSIKKDTRYMLTMTFDGISTTYRGENGEVGPAVRDGPTFSFHDAPLRNNCTDVSRGQFPVILFERGAWVGELSFRRGVIETCIPLHEASYEQTSEEVKLNRFRFSVIINKEENRLSATLNCQPMKEFPNWSVEAHALCRLVHPTTRSKSLRFTARQSFNSEVNAMSLFTVQAGDYADWISTEIEEAILETTIRYASATPPPEIEPLEVRGFDKPLRGSDVILHFDDGRQLHCHKQMLSFASPVFQRMLEADFKEKRDSVITLPGKKSEVFEKVLRFLYPCETPQKTSFSDALDLAEICHEYEMERLEQRAQKVLLGGVDHSNAIRLLRLATSVQFDELEDVCLRICSLFTNDDLKSDREYYLLDDFTRELVQDARQLRAGLE